MAKLLFIFLPVFILTACANKRSDINLQEQLREDTTLNAQQIIFAQPQMIGNSQIVIYPLILEKETYAIGYSGGKGVQRTRYWNLIFYNTETQNQNLLTTDKKILISSINWNDSPSSDDLLTSGFNVYKNNILYTVVANDYNANNQLDENDPTYLFVSNKDGTNFRQISPDSCNIDSWEVVKGTTKVIMQGQKDHNEDKVFDEKDATIPFVVDINSGKMAAEAFKQNFIDSLNLRLVKIWKQ
ncbi:MAG: hypothetical protein NW218_09420 [Saprospiraceae bacterium]|nr:hypothetical protein [Saprospiraceae bacterium]